jgi:DNA-binding protein H-NS
MEPTKKQPSKLKGRKLEPKYKDPASGKTWAGMGRLPKWLVKAMEAGADRDSFIICS